MEFNGRVVVIYPWGSGDDPGEKRNKEFLDTVEDLKRKGLSVTEIMQGLSINSTEFRAKMTIAKNQQKAAEMSEAYRLKYVHGYSTMEIGRRMNKNESSVRALLDPAAKDKVDLLTATANMLKEQVDKKTFVDVGTGTELLPPVGVSRTRLDIALHMLKEDGYEIHPVQVPQLGTGPGNMTRYKVLCPPGATYVDAKKAALAGQLHLLSDMTSDNSGRTFYGIMPPLNVDSKRIAIRYKEEGGGEADGVIYVRRGVPDVSIGSNRYAQVRISVDGTHYIKGMAIYKDDLPPGTDLIFNVNKKDSGNKLDALKPLKEDIDNPFGSVVRQIGEHDEKGYITKVTSAMNLVNEEGEWDKWSRNLSSQFLSKQKPRLAKEQLNMTYEKKKNQLDEILRLTNPAVRKKLLDSFASGADSSAIHLKAAHLPRQASHVILPISSLKQNEVYAPKYDNGERVVLIRHPHGGPFEIPELIVNNRNREANKILGQSEDAIGINSKVAKHLSGADFDGDSVLVIPNNHGKVTTAPALSGLKNFDPQAEYPGYKGMKVMDARVKGLEMGNISNLITDMTIGRANNAELAAAVRHSMVVIDAEKHELNWTQSAKNNNITHLKAKYQSLPGRTGLGASTLISRARRRVDVPDYRPRKASEGQPGNRGPVDTKTGEKVFIPTGKMIPERRLRKDPTTGEKVKVLTGNMVPKMKRSKELIEAKDAHELSSGTVIEHLYAEHSNKLKALANIARKEAVNTKPTPVSSRAKLAYGDEVKTLNAKLNLAIANRPLERQAQVIAHAQYEARRQANPNMEDDEKKKIQAQLLFEARKRTGAAKQDIKIEPNEWAAIQAGAISNNKLEQILMKADLDIVKKLATPRVNTQMTSAKQTRARSMLASGYTQAEVAAHLGVPVSTLTSSIGRGEEG
jgi:hypothetical protein